MTRTLFRTFLALVLVLTFGVHERVGAGAPCTSPCPARLRHPHAVADSNDKTVWYVVGGIAAAALGAFIAWRLFPTPERGLPPEPPSGDPPPVTPVNLPPPGGGAGAPSAARGTPKVTTTARARDSTCRRPAPGSWPTR